MTLPTPRLTLCTLLVLIALSCNHAQAVTLRGFGTVQESRLPNGTGMKFTCDSPAHAVLLIHKLARDMAQSATGQSLWVQVNFGGQLVPVLFKSDLGAYLALAQGNDAYCFTASPAPAGENNWAAGFAAAVPLLPGAQLYDPNYTCPAYLDKWSDKGLGTWYTLYGPFGDDPPGLKDIVDPHFQYMTENGLTVHLTDYGVSRREAQYFIEKYQRPYHFAHWLDWDADIARLDPFDLITPGNLFTGYSDYYTGISFGGDKLQEYRDWHHQNLLREHVNDPLMVDWDEPHGEIGPQNYLSRNDYGPENRAHFVKWLQTDRKYTLSTLGQAWYHNPHAFKSWDAVPIPYDYALYGFDKNSLFADPTWRLHLADVAPGVTAGYARPETDDTRWPSFQMPGGDLGALMNAAHKRFWFRGTVTVPAHYLQTHKGPLYLAVASLTQGGGPTNADHVWFNGVDLGGLSTGGGIDIAGSKGITGLVHPGVNHIAYSPAADYIPGGFFLSTKPMKVYPFSDSGLNARTVDWHDYISNCALEEERHTIQTIRGTDPNRPIKVMAVQDKDLFSPMMADYGCFTHNTGDEAFFYPWDKRLAYPYGYRADAESSASMVTSDGFKHWLGWFTFSGLNAFDNFIDVESMMYSPVTPLWKENFPYLHLANRYDMKKPEIGLLWSGPNLRLSPGGHSALPFCWDLGRGDLQPLGYSYAYFDEPGLHRNLADGYKVLWDCGTYVMSKETVEDIRRYVEGGGTYVALAETGRHTLTEKDAWPIESLSGFKVKEVRPMGGFVSILNDQPLFTTLAGQNFENSGRSIDYSGFNYADKCVALEPSAPGTEAIARYRDGAIAVGMRRLGKGRVIVLGSPFWRDSYDRAGMWWPSAAQETFLKDLLTGLGVPPDVPSDTTTVWRDRYVATNGTEEYLILFNPDAAVPQPVTTDWHTDFPIKEVYDPKTAQPFPVTINGKTARVSMTLQPYETKILAAQILRPPADTVADWFASTATTWKGTAPGRTAVRPDLPFYTSDFPPGVGKIVDTASVTPERLASLSSAETEKGWDPHLDMIRPFYAGKTAEPGQSVLYRSVATVPASWHPGDAYRLRLKQFQTNFQGVVYLNGKQVATSQQVSDAQIDQFQNDGVDVTGAIHLTGPNILVIAANEGGFAGDADLWRQPAATATLSLAGPWTVIATEDSGPTTTTLPGSFTGLLATRTVVVPAAWKGSHVFLRLDCGKNLPGHIAINNKVFAYESFTPNYMDVTPWINFGGPNTVLLQPTKAMQGWVPGTQVVNSAVLERVARV